ncbi:MAG: ABC transporter permease [Armatimonadota bacterium]|jgi:ABC-2 type transport system permease protein
MTTLEHILIIGQKEAREILTNRGLAFSGIFFATWFSIMAGLGITEEHITQQVQLDNSLFYMGALIGLFVGYIYSGQTYLREKQSGIVETLLCSPVSLRSIWIGKALGVAIPSTILSLLSATAITFIVGYRASATIVPGLIVFVHLLVVVPIFIVAAVALMGFGQLMLGMRENMVVNMLTIMLLFGALAATRLIVEEAELVTWTAVGALAGASLGLLAITWALGRLLSRERIVRTIS